MTSKLPPYRNLYWRFLFAWRRQEGQGMVEYALILVLISIVVIVVLLTMGAQIRDVFVNVAKALGMQCTAGTNCFG
jgi:pilus assembly protein Flp/PilA